MSEAERTPIRIGEPGDRVPAPGPLAIVQSFVNTVDLEDDLEELADPASLAAWFRQHELVEADTAISPDDLHRAREFREALRALLVANAGGDLDPDALNVVNQVAETSRLSPVFSGNATATLQPGSGGVEGALGRLLAIVFAAMTDGSWLRLKACRHDPCRWAFYDASKNRSGAWCSMSICGNKVKTRAYRSRRAR